MDVANAHQMGCVGKPTLKGYNYVGDLCFAIFLHDLWPLAQSYLM